MYKSYLAENRGYFEIPENQRLKLVQEGKINICLAPHTNLESADTDLKEGFIYHINDPANSDEILRGLKECPES